MTENSSTASSGGDQVASLEDLRKTAATVIASNAAKADKDGIIVLAGPGTWQLTAAMARNPWMTFGTGVATGAIGMGVAVATSDTVAGWLGRK